VKVSRTDFLKACAAALVGTRVDARALFDTAGESSTSGIPARLSARLTGGRLRLNKADAQLFRQHLNTAFAVRAGEGTRARLVLAKVVERPAAKNVQQFSLTFHAPARTTVRQGMHAFQHPALGRFDLFIVPIGAPNGRRTVYQACFSRHRSPDEIVRGQAIASTRRRT